MRIVATQLAFLMCSGSAFASGGAQCLSEGGPAKVVIEAGITRGMGGPVFSLNASADVDGKNIPQDLNKSKFTKEQLAQYWFDGEDLRFLLYRERDGDGEFGSVELTVEAKSAGDEMTYAGTYRISVFDAGASEPATFEGRISCSVE